MIKQFELRGMQEQLVACKQGAAGGDPLLTQTQADVGEQPPPLCPASAGVLGAARVGGGFPQLTSMRVIVLHWHPR